MLILRRTNFAYYEVLSQDLRVGQQILACLHPQRLLRLPQFGKAYVAKDGTCLQPLRFAKPC